MGEARIKKLAAEAASAAPKVEAKAVGAGGIGAVVSKVAPFVGKAAAGSVIAAVTGGVVSHHVQASLQKGKGGSAQPIYSTGPVILGGSNLAKYQNGRNYEQ